MLFNSGDFIFLFLPVTLALYFTIARYSHSTAAGWLIAASLFFCGWWNTKYLRLLLFSIAMNFNAGRLIIRAPTLSARRMLLFVGVTANLVVLGYCKYIDFGITIVNDVADAHLPLLHIVLPLGISFFTFTQIAYLADAYYGKVKTSNICCGFPGCGRADRNGAPEPISIFPVLAAAINPCR